MMRKTFLVLLGAASGAALTLLATQPRLVHDRLRLQREGGRGRHLPAAQPVRRRVRARARRLRREAGRRQADRIRDQRHALRARSAFELHGAEGFRDMQVQTRGEFGGLGIEVTMEDGLIKVVSPIDDTPAAKAGVMANDIITKLDDEQVQGLTLNQAVEKMRGPVNTKIKLTIMRKGQDKPIEVSHHARRHPRAGGALAAGGRCRLHPHHPVQRADHREPEEGDHRSADPDPGRQAQGLRDRSAQQSGRPARPGDLGVGRVPGAGRDRLDPRPQRRRDPALQRPRRRPRSRASR